MQVCNRSSLPFRNPRNNDGGSLLSRCRRARRVLDGGGGDDEQPLEHGVVTTSALLHEDALAAVFARLHDDGPAVVRCAVTCRRWARVVSREAAALARALPPLGSLALGFFHQDDDVTGRRRSGPFFVPTTSGSRLLGSTTSSLLDGVHGVDSDFSRPERPLVLELRREVRADGLRLCVCDPVTGAADVLPPLSGQDKPGYYVCALLTGEDADPPVLSPAYFRLLLVYNRRGFTALRRYSSGTGSWGPEAKADTRVSTGWLHGNMVQATALRGAVYWPLDRFVLGPRGTPRRKHVVVHGPIHGALRLPGEDPLVPIREREQGHLRLAGQEAVLGWPHTLWGHPWSGHAKLLPR
ncbi:hypothetical protein BRADI_3g54902v3 [Brachypodium distachyon]|uniref:F-box domain-containing protein n=1 Tax=Brachypodium distachyon TaxID=15368 RepID=A0A2K2D556_BRADI|nr:hypothetical protein BRADI_3g54902v3 [Brachypodium distachyon]